MESQINIGILRLRGLAALLVVVGHAFHPYALNPAQNMFNPVFLVISSATVIFVLIAGMLFRVRTFPKLSEGRTSTREILRKRWAELSGLYLTLGLFLALVVGYKEGLREGLNPALHAAKLFFNGTMAHSYWYVPFFLLLMALAPAHLWFCNQRPGVQRSLVVSGLILSALVHRPDADATLGAVHSLVYYLPVFWIGLILGRDIPALLAWLRHKELFLGGALVAVIAGQVAIGQDRVYLTYIGERWGMVDLFVVQKLIFGLLFLSVFHRTQYMAMPLMDWISENSLKIFFMHCPILILIMWFPHVSGFYVPEIVAVTCITILGGLMLLGSLERVFTQFKPILQRHVIKLS